jgi:hypothetical protein
MSKLSAEIVDEALVQILQFSKEKKRGFVETVELQIGTSHERS